MNRQRLRDLLTEATPQLAPVSLGGRLEAIPSLGRQLACVDWIVLIYATWVGALMVWNAGNIAEWSGLVLAHAGIVLFVLALPPRGATWESRPITNWGSSHARDVLRFLRYAYPLPLMVVFFEETRFTVNAIYPDSPYWFEQYLYTADRVLFGDLPSRLLKPWNSTVITEIMHAFYFSYYPILIGGLIVAWRGTQRSANLAASCPGPGFDLLMVSMILGLVLPYVHYPWLAARGPWENAVLMAETPPFEGPLFTPIIEFIIYHGSVSGGCFPSSHVGGAWGVVLGLAWTPAHRRSAIVMAVLATGLSAACVYTRYHHGVDVLAGALCGLAGGLLGRLLVRASSQPSVCVPLSRG